MSEKKIYCTHCGKQLDTNTEVCDACGKKINEPDHLLQEFLIKHTKEKLREGVEDSLYDAIKNWLMSHLYGILVTITVVVVGVTGVNRVITRSQATTNTNTIVDRPEVLQFNYGTVNNDHSIYNPTITSFIELYESEGARDEIGNAYGFYDLNEDGVDELIIGHSSNDSTGDVYIELVVGIYTVNNGDVIQVVEGWSRSGYHIYEGNYILHSWSNSVDDSGDEVLILNRNGELETTDMTYEQLGEIIKMEIVVLGEANNNVDNGSVVYRSFDEILEEVVNAYNIPESEYESDASYYNALYSFLGDGVVWYLQNPEYEIYTLSFFYREYDLDGDGEDELLLGRGVSPSRVMPIAVYNTNEEPIVGDDLNQFTFPDDGYGESPMWYYLVG